MKKSRKITLLVLSIVSLVFFAGAMVLFFLMPQILEADGMLGSNFLLLKETYIYTFDKTKAEELVFVYNEQTALILGIVQLVFAGLVLIALVLGIVFVCTKKRPASILFPLLLALTGFGGALLIALGGYLLEGYKQLSEIPELAGKAIVLLLFIILAILAFVLALVVYILSLVFAGKTSKENANVDEDVSVIADEAGDPEAIQEGDELDFAAPQALAAPVVEPEPAHAQEEEPQVEAEPEPQKVEVNVNQAGVDQQSLATLLREVVRDIVRDEIARNNLNQPQQQPQQPGNQSITGATFGGPLVVQYFNGAINPVGPQEAKQEEKEEPKEQTASVEEPKQDEVKEQPVVGETPVVEEVKEEPVPEVVPEPVVEAAPEVKPEAPKYERLTFTERLLQSEEDVHALYNELKNEILSWGVKSRISANGDTFRLHKKMYVRITVAGKALKLYFALNPADYANTTLPIQDASDKDMYQEIPLVFKVKSGLSVRRCKDLIRDVMEKDNLEQGQIEKINWIKELKAQAAEDAKNEKAEDAD